MSTASTPLPHTPEPIATVRQHIESFNNGDPKGMAATCAVPMSILDGMAPHVWHGPTACEDWYRDAMIEGEPLGATDYFVDLGEPKHNTITGERIRCNSYDYVVQTERHSDYAVRGDVHRGASEDQR
jgi:hypothetical protein